MTTSPPASARGWHRALLVLALLLLNVSLTFRNVWPTPGVTWRGDLSIELAVCLLVFALASHVYGRTPRRLVQTVSVLWVLLALGRYADVTAPAVYGREINLFWDLRHAAAVIAMLAEALPVWALALAGVCTCVVWLCLHRSARWALTRLAEGMHHPQERRALAATGVVLLALFATQQVVGSVEPLPAFTTPVTESYARQVRLLSSGFLASPRIPPPAPLTGRFDGVEGADVLLVFVESYGAVAYDDPFIAGSLAAGRGDLAAAIADSGREVVSAFVESPTFGGSSWLAHVSLLSGVEVKDEDANRQIMAQRRDTLVTLFARNGFRTVAAMPGNSHPWPEGSFYGFDEIYDRARLAYRGPRFGWWFVPDQFTLARFDQLVRESRPRRPVFAVVPTISTHAPFGPTAPYVEDWGRLLTPDPYPSDLAAAALARKPDLLNLGPSYAQAVGYTYQSIGGYLRRRAGEDLVMIVIGDHQPAAAVSGEGARWDVPVHVIGSRRAVLDRLIQRGFVPGLTPRRNRVSQMHALLPWLVEAFGARVP